ncbi:hypothetical protein [Streptomyces sp. NPDC091259]|uniref:hypothetical protein n=1 Tax=Streptomyces sp. NPDC091259 TaxID=3365976 RepID=UPI0038132A4B
MAKITATATYTIELTARELDIIRVALGLVRNFGDVTDWDDAGVLRDALEVEA